MLNNQTVNKLIELKLKIMAQILNEPDPMMEELSFEDRFGIMVEKEWESRKNNRIKRLLTQASLSLNACIEDLNYSPERRLDKKTIQKLSSCIFVEHKLNVIVSGKTGTGKSFLICALGNRACRSGYTVKYYRIPELLLEMQVAKSEGRYSKFLRSLQNVKVLILDDIGLKSYTLEESRDIYEIIEGRYNKGSCILSGQMQHEKWFELFPDPTVADAIMDRIEYNSYILKLESKKSMREVTAEKKIKSIDNTNEMAMTT